MLEIHLSISNVLYNIYYCLLAQFLLIRVPTVVTEPYFAKFGQHRCMKLKFETFRTLPNPIRVFVPHTPVQRSKRSSRTNERTSKLTSFFSGMDFLVIKIQMIQEHVLKVVVIKCHFNNDIPRFIFSQTNHNDQPSLE
jgi:hypothetical protein